MRTTSLFSFVLVVVCGLGMVVEAFVGGPSTVGFKPVATTTSATSIHEKLLRRGTININTPNIYPKCAAGTFNPAKPFLSTSTSSSSSTARHAMPVRTMAAMVVPHAKKKLVKGKFTMFISKFLISPDQAWLIAKKLGVFVLKDAGEFIMIAVMIKASKPLARRLYTSRNRLPAESSNTYDEDMDRFEKRFERSKTLRVAQLVQEVGVLLAFLFGVEVMVLLLDELKFEFVRTYPIYQWTVSIVTSIWGARNLSDFKAFVLSRGHRLDMSKSPGIRLINRALDILLFGATGLLILDFLSVQTGFALKSFFGLSSVGTLVFSLASKELVSEFLASLAIQGTNIYSEGDRILLADGTTGTVQKLGWLNTHLRRGDELVVRIPNTQLSGSRISNISRAKLSTVKQALAISYDDLEKLPRLIRDIKEEIRASCPTLIDDGSRSFQVFFTEYKEKSVEVMVSAHFRTKPFCDAYWEVKQEVLLAIGRATKKNGVSFSYVNFMPNGALPVMLE